MPVVIKASDNGFVDAGKRIVKLPSYLGLVGERRDALRRAAAAATAAAAAAMLSFSALPAMGTVIPLSNGGVSANVDITGGGGVTTLDINGVNQVNSTEGQWYYVRVGAPSSMGAAQVLNNTAFTLTDSSTTSTLDTTYTSGSSYNVKVDYTGLVGATNQAQLPQSITIDNLSTSSSLTISLYEYNHFNLNGQTKDNVTFVNTPVNTADQNSTTGASMSEVNTTPSPSAYQAAAGSTLLTDLTGSSFAGLNDTNTVSSGANDATWAFEWDFTIPADSSVQVSKNVNVNVPEPATLSLAMGGMSVLGFRRRRRQSV
jgi:PEP-CTERM motif-containing protein